MNKGTKDVRFIVALYDLAKETGDIYQPINKYEVGKSVGIKERAVNAITKLLVQANFIKKVDEELVSLAQHGEELVKRLRHLK